MEKARNHSPWPYRTLTWVAAILTFLLVVGTLVADEASDQAATQAAEDEFHLYAEVFNEVFHEIQQKYYSEIDTSTLMEAAIQGMFLALDPHSQFMPPDTYQQLTQSIQGDFYGIGIHITMRDGVLTVIAPIPNTPSARLGIQPWDRIIEIDGESTEGMSLQEAVRNLKGPENTTVDVKIFRAPQSGEGPGEFLDFTITRAKIEINSVNHQVVNDNVGYMRISTFSEETAADLREALHDLLEQGVDALILDLRFNGGGALVQAKEVCDLFLPTGALIVRTEGRLPGNNTEFRCDREAYTDLPMLVLVNEGSASASEIVAGALQDHHRAIIIGPEGATTFGKATVQTIEELTHAYSFDDEGNPRPAGVRITTAHYFTPSGRDLHDVGITPDIGVPIPDGHNLQLLRRGLLGDPTVIEDEGHLEAVRDALQERNGDETSTVASGEAMTNGSRSTTDVDLLLNRLEEEGLDITVLRDAIHAMDEDEETEEFHDIMLDEAIRYLEVYLQMEGQIG